jgi:DNA-binding NarL/FixJ family response regulator
VIRVLLADDHEMVRRGLRTFLDLQEDIEVVGEAGDGAACLQLAATAKPDVILLDLLMPGVDGLAALRALRAAGDPVAVLVVTSIAEPGPVVAAVRAGATGAVFKDIDPHALAAAIRTVHAGHVLLPPSIADALMAGGDDTGRVGNLTPREVEVLSEIARGRSNREIARAFTLSEKTVKTHVSSILMKLDLADRTQAALYAVRHGLV